MTEIHGWVTLRTVVHLEHGVVVLRRTRNDLQHIPVLDDLSGIVESEDVDASVFVVARPGLVAMQNNEIVLCDRPFELNALAGVVRGHALEVLDERLLSIAHLRVVLGVRSRRHRLQWLPAAGTD